MSSGLKMTEPEPQPPTFSRLPFYLAGGFLIVGIAAGCILFALRPRPKPMKVDFEGHEGLHIAGTYIADGVEHEFEGVIPTGFQVTAMELYFTVFRTTDEGDFRGLLCVENRVDSMGTDFMGHAGVSGYARITWTSATRGVMTIDRGDRNPFYY